MNILPEVSSSKKKEISLWADWGESEPWTQFFSESSPHSALILKMDVNWQLGNPASNYKVDQPMILNYLNEKDGNTMYK